MVTMVTMVRIRTAEIGSFFLMTVRFRGITSDISRDLEANHGHHRHHPPPARVEGDATRLARPRFVTMRGERAQPRRSAGVPTRAWICSRLAA